MALAVVSSVLARIGDLLSEEAKFLHGVKDQVVELQRELIRMKCFLEDADAIRDKDKRVHNWITEIRDLAYRSEDAVETFIFEVASRKRKGGGCHNFMRRSARFLNEVITLHKLGSEMKTIKVEISNLTSSLQSYGIKDLSPSAEGGSSSSAQEKRLLLRRTYSHVIEEDFVGFQEDIATLVAALVDEDKQFRAISICGMGGSGKTTLATKVYRHPTVRRRFDAFAWACVSQEWKKEDVLQRILINLMPEKRKEILTMRDEELVKQLFEIQGSKSCLVVLDDIWSTDVWNIIRSAFPNGKTGRSKILLTSRYEVVAEHVDPSVFLHKTRLLDDEESWELFRKKAFLGGDDTDATIDQKMELGRKIVKRCGGLPLAIVVLGGLLVRKPLNEWQKVHQNLHSYLRRDKSHREQGMGVSEVLALSYHDLPYWLKPCFLYLGNYPEDEEIETEKLYLLWMAEGFISVEEEERGEKEAMMEVAERYLGELAQRCMVQVQIEDDYDSTTSNNRRFKSCQIHDLMREMCLSMVKEENFLKVVDFRHRNDQQQLCSSSSSSFLATSSTHSSKIHRLAIYLDWDVHEALEDTRRYLSFDQEINFRSVLFFYIRMPIGAFCEQMVSNFPKKFKSTRVLDLEGFVLSDSKTALPEAIGNLIHLRYLSLRDSEFNKLPSSIGNLKYLQTLDLRVNFDLTVPNVLWKLEQLRHLYFPLIDLDSPKSYFVASGKLRLDGLNNLETLENIIVDCCNVKEIQKLTNLRELIVESVQMTHQDLAEIICYLKSVTQKRRLLQHSSVFVRGFNFCSEEELTLLRQIFLECHRVHKLYIEGVICALPEYQQGSSHSSSLTHLTLSGSKLKDDPFARLEKLPHLISLSLLDKSFVGKEMICSAQGFAHLKTLELVNLPNLRKWTVEEGAMPSLSTLEISDCTKLKMVPDGLRFVTTLKELIVHSMYQVFIDRLCELDGKEGEDFDKVRHVPSIKLESIEHMWQLMRPHATAIRAAVMFRQAGLQAGPLNS